MNILYLGDSSPSATSMHRAGALRRLGQDVTVRDPWPIVMAHCRHRLVDWLHYHSGYAALQRTMVEWLRGSAADIARADIVWVDGGEFFGPAAMTALRGMTGARFVLFNHDDPTGSRDGGRFRSLRAALPWYDVLVAVREPSEREYRQLCRGKVVRVWRGYDEVCHAPGLAADPIPPEFRSEVAFIGTWMRGEGREEVVLELARRGIDVAIWGGRWPRAPGWRRLRPLWRGPAIGGADYVSAIRGAKLCLGLLSKGNRDLHTTRSMEIPYAGGVLLAQRTPEHEALYRDGSEAVLWSTVDEAATRVRALLADSAGLERIRQAGMARVRGNRVGNEDMCRTILAAACDG